MGGGVSINAAPGGGDGSPPGALVRCEPASRCRPKGAAATLLVVDDDQVTVMSVKRALRKRGLSTAVKTACDGVEAMEILRGSASDRPLPPPYVVLLDINMPRMNGHEFLAELRQDPNLRQTIVFILSTSDTPEDIASAYDQNVAGYIIKEDLGQSVDTALSILGHYLSGVALPHPRQVTDG